MQPLSVQPFVVCRTPCPQPMMVACNPMIDCNHLPCCHVQITSLLFLPDFPGWTAPLHFNPIRFEELAIFCITLCVCWIGACGVVGGYRTGATASERAACFGSLKVPLACSPCINHSLATGAPPMRHPCYIYDVYRGHVLALFCEQQCLFTQLNSSHTLLTLMPHAWLQICRRPWPA